MQNEEHFLANKFWKRQEELATHALPGLTCRNKHEKSEGFSASCQGGKFEIVGDSVLAEAFGASQVSRAILAGHEAELLEIKLFPYFSLRPLWLLADELCSLTQSLYLGISQLLASSCKETSLSNLNYLCERTIELGYNALVIGSLASTSATPSSTASIEEVASICKQIKSYGLKVIFAPTCKTHTTCPADPSFRDLLKEDFVHIEPILQEIDYLFWQSLHLDATYEEFKGASDCTHFELLVKEVALLEMFEIPLIFYLPSSQDCKNEVAAWTERLLDEVKMCSMISFPSTLDLFSLDTEELNPLFYELRKSPDCSSTRLLPLVNIGCIEMGEGLWPVLGLSLMEKVSAYMQRHPFAGFIALTKEIPQQKSLLDASLWVGAQVLWYQKPVLLFLETWLRGFRPHWSLNHAIEAIRSAENILRQMSDLKKYKATVSFEKLKFYVDALMAQLYIFQQLARKVDASSERSLAFLTYATGFMIDIKKWIQVICGNFSLPHFLTIDDTKDSFWEIHPTSFSRKPLEKMTDPLFAYIYKASIFFS